MNGFQLISLKYESTYKFYNTVFLISLNFPCISTHSSPLNPLHICKHKDPKHQLAAKYMQESITNLVTDLKKKIKVSYSYVFMFRSSHANLWIFHTANTEKICFSSMGKEERLLGREIPHMGKTPRQPS